MSKAARWTFRLILLALLLLALLVAHTLTMRPAKIGWFFERVFAEFAAHGLDLGPLRPSLLRRLETASGKIECTPAVMMEALAELANTRGATTATATAGPFDEHAQESLLLIGRRELRSNNSWMHNAPRLIKGKLRHHLLMHADDLARRSMADGARVRVRSETGSIEVEVQRSDSIMRGVAIWVEAIR